VGTVQIGELAEEATSGGMGRISSSIGWGKSDLLDDGAVSFVRVKEIEGRVVLNPEQERRMLATALFEKRQGFGTTAEPGV
jgi:hypothetical protein